jgi:hypothetical protein
MPAAAHLALPLVRPKWKREAALEGIGTFVGARVAGFAGVPGESGDVEGKVEADDAKSTTRRAPKEAAQEETRRDRPKNPLRVGHGWVDVGLWVLADVAVETGLSAGIDLLEIIGIEEALVHTDEPDIIGFVVSEVEAVATKEQSLSRIDCRLRVEDEEPVRDSGFAPFRSIGFVLVALAVVSDRPGADRHIEVVAL